MIIVILLDVLCRGILAPFGPAFLPEGKTADFPFPNIHLAIPFIGRIRAKL
jgi:hypothetical protein